MTYTGWSTKAPITVTNPPGVSDYQVRVTVPYRAEMQGDFDDIRFGLEDGTTYPYWIETFTASSTATVWVKVPASTATFYIYYGNAAATSESSGADVMDFFDDFPGTSLDSSKWNTYSSGAGIAVSSGILTITGSTSNQRGVQAKTGGGQNTVMMTRAQIPDVLNGPLGYMSAPLDVFCTFGPRESAGQDVTNTYVAGYETQIHAFDNSAYHVFEIKRNGSTNVIFSVDRSTLATHSTKVPSNAVTLYETAYLYQVTGTYRLDWAAVRKCQATEPTTSVGTGTTNVLTITAEMGRSLTLEAGTHLEGTITAEIGRSLAPLADAYEPPDELIAEMGRGLTLAATALLETTIAAELTRGLGLGAGGSLEVGITAEMGRGLTLAATALLETTITAEMERGLSPTPPRTAYWYNFDGVKWISSTTRRSITDHFHQLDEEISGAEELPIDFLRQAKVIAEDLHGTRRCIFYGMLPGIDQKIAWRRNTTTIRGYDHGWRLSDQKVPAARRVISPTVDPRDVVLEFLGGNSWETKTEVRPYRIAPLTAYGTEAMPAHQWEFSPETSCMEAIREFDEKCDRIFLVKWMQIGNAISVDNPDPSRRLMRVEAEDFDPGGEGVGYHDVDTRNLGGAFRTGEGVDIENTPGEGGRNVGWIRDGEWLDFTREFAWAGSYAFSARVGAAAQATPAYFKVYLDGVYQFRINVGAAPTSDAGYRTGSYQVFTNTDPDRLTSTSGAVLADAPQYLDITSTGDHVIRLEFWGNTENITPSVMHQNIARFDLSPQGGTEIDPDDVRYQSIAYWVDEEKIDSATEGLDLPPPLTISDPGRWPKDGTIQITKQARQRYNRVIVRGHSASGVWFEATAQTSAVAAGEPPSEYLETNDRVTVSTIQGYANALLAYYQLDQRSYQCTLMQQMGLEIYQKIRFTDHPQLPSAWCRITSTEKRVDGKEDSCTITFVPDQTLAAQRRLQRMLRPTNSSAITDVVRSEIAKQSEVWVATCAEILDANTANFTLEQGGTSRGRIALDD